MCNRGQLLIIEMAFPLHIADTLRDEIERNLILPGERLIEMQVARRFGVSQGPVREALRMLEREGLVDHRPRRGVYVRPISVRDIEEIYSLRAAVEGLAARRAALLMTSEDRAAMENVWLAMREAASSEDPIALVEAALALHERIALAARHTRLYAVWQTIASQTRRFAHLHGRFDDYEADVRQHRELISALFAGDPAVAEGAMKAHVRDAGWALLRHALAAGLLEAPAEHGTFGSEEWSILVSLETSEVRSHGRWLDRLQLALDK